MMIPLDDRRAKKTGPPNGATGHPWTGPRPDPPIRIRLNACSALIGILPQQ
jgi:hypothetical protein